MKYQEKLSLTKQFLSMFLVIALMFMMSFSLNVNAMGDDLTQDPAVTEEADEADVTDEAEEADVTEEADAADEEGEEAPVSDRSLQGETAETEELGTGVANDDATDTEEDETLGDESVNNRSQSGGGKFKAKIKVSGTDAKEVQKVFQQLLMIVMAMLMAFMMAFTKMFENKEKEEDDDDTTGEPIDEDPSVEDPSVEDPEGEQDGPWNEPGYYDYEDLKKWVEVLIDGVEDEDEKAEFEAKLEEIDNSDKSYEEKLEDLKALEKELEESGVEVDDDKKIEHYSILLTDKIAEITDEEKKADFQDRFDEIKNSEDDNETKISEMEALISEVNEYIKEEAAGEDEPAGEGEEDENTKVQDLIDSLTDKIDKITDEEKKADFQKRFDEIKNSKDDNQTKISAMEDLIKEVDEYIKDQGEGDTTEEGEGDTTEEGEGDTKVGENTEVDDYKALKEEVEEMVNNLKDGKDKENFEAKIRAIEVTKDSYASKILRLEELKKDIEEI